MNCRNRIKQCSCEVLLMPYEKLLLPGADPARQRVLQNISRQNGERAERVSPGEDFQNLQILYSFAEF